MRKNKCERFRQELKKNVTDYTEKYKTAESVN